MNEKEDRFKNISILYLCEREIYLHRTSRVRFHAVNAIEKRCRVLWSGPGWKNWNSEKSLDENIDQLYKGGKKPDFIFCYKPLNIKGFAVIRIPTCVSYNEMGTQPHPRSYTVNEIMENHVDLVICHHHNEMLYPEFSNLPCKMVNISHCAEKTIFKDYHLPKDIDVLLVGALRSRRYLLRRRMLKIILKMRVDPKFSKFKIGILGQPGERYPNAHTNKQIIEYAKEINRSKVCLTCSGRYRSRYGKFTEIPACRSLLMADLPDEDHEFFRQFTVVIDLEDSDEEIQDKIHYFLHHDEERERMTDLGYELTRSHYTQEHYAERFLTAVSDYLREYNGQKLPYWAREDF